MFLLKVVFDLGIRVGFDQWFYIEKGVNYVEKLLLFLNGRLHQSDQWFQNDEVLVFIFFLVGFDDFHKLKETGDIQILVE